MFAEYGLKPLWDILTGVSTAQSSLGLESVLFGGGGLGSHQHQQPQNETSKDQNNVKIQATTVGMADMVMDALQIGPTSANPAGGAGHSKVPQTLEEMQVILNKATSSSEESIVRALLRRHRPLSDAVLDSVCDICPSPRDASRQFRRQALSLVNRDLDQMFEEQDEGTVCGSEHLSEEFKKIQEAVRECAETEDDKIGEMTPPTPTVAHCCKFISTDRAQINDPELLSYLDASVELAGGGHGGETNANNNGIILGVARVLSGTLRSKDVEYYCFGPKHDASTPETENVPKRRIRLYLLMGSTYVRVKMIPAGHICAIHGLEELQLKTMTLCSSEYGMPLNTLLMGLRPLVKVNVEAVSNSGESFSCSIVLWITSSL